MILNEIIDTINPAIFAAIITAIFSLLISIIGIIASRRNQQNVEMLKADLAEKNAVKNAKLEYEFDARKKLYQECAPLLFELSEISERALGRIVRIANASSEGKIDGGPESWMRRNYFNRSTFYRLIVPLCFNKLLRSKLTIVDLSLDSTMHLQYMLCKQLEDTFTDDFEYAKLSPRKLNYDPHNKDVIKLRKKNPAVYCQQGVPRGILDNAVSSLIVEDESSRGRIMTFAEFESGMDDKKSSVSASFNRIEYLFEDFHPRTRPVLWRIMMVQANMYKALLLIKGNKPVSNLEEHLWDDDTLNFDWRNEKEKVSISDENIKSEIAIAYNFSKDIIKKLIEKTS